MDKIIIRDLLAKGIIGINGWERETPQEILVNLTLFADITQAAFVDDLKLSVDYHEIAKKVLSLVQKSSRYTVEALAEDIASLCLHEENVVKIKVRVEKPGALPFARSAGVEIVRKRKNND